MVSSSEGNNQHMNKTQQRDVIDTIIRVCWGNLEKVVLQRAGEDFEEEVTFFFKGAY